MGPQRRMHLPSLFLAEPELAIQDHLRKEDLFLGLVTITCLRVPDKVNFRKERFVLTYSQKVQLPRAKGDRNQRQVDTLCQTVGHSSSQKSGREEMNSGVGFTFLLFFLSTPHPLRNQVCPWNRTLAILDWLCSPGWPLPASTSGLLEFKGMCHHALCWVSYLVRDLRP